MLRLLMAITVAVVERRVRSALAARMSGGRAPGSAIAADRERADQ
jgi:hypothetical protein